MMTEYEKLKDPLYFQENRTDPHSDHTAFAPGDQEVSSFRKNLNGKWLFSYARNFDEALQGFESTDYDTDAWEQIRVPGHIQLQGYDAPQYVNTQYPWDGREDIHPGQIPQAFNPIGHYVTFFEVPEFFDGKRVFISFQGVESSFRLWLNGRYIGFASDSFTPSEFELTAYLQKGKNKLAVQVFKWYSGSWLEDQDFFRFSGIFRDVYLYAVSAHHVRDIKVTADYDPQNPEEGQITAVLQMMAGGCIVALELFSPTGELLEAKEETVAEPDPAPFSFTVQHPLLWSAEQPNLYQLRVTVRNGTETEEWFCQPVGIRHFAMDGNIMKLNGKRLVLKGVNRHEFSAAQGRVVTEEELLQDLYTMKRSNINAIRLCHYPNSSRIYALADELGFYLIDECNMETHGSWDVVERGLEPSTYAVPGDHREYEPMLLDRLHSMYQRDKNHPCILIWSLGNESYGGSVIHAMSRAIRQLDPSRLVHYEGIFHDRRYPDTSDMESQMYTPVQKIREFLAEHREKPFICCEYMHAMGNSCGALYKYTDLTEEEELYQGGFIWDYIDQAIIRRDRYGKEYFAYGGDHRERPHDGNFSGNGLVDARRNPTPKLAEARYCYQNITVRFKDAKEHFTVINKNLFINTSAYQCVVILERNGALLQEVPFETDVPALSEKSYALPFAIPKEPGEYTVTVSFRLKEKTAWADAGHEAAFDQFTVLREEPATAPYPQEPVLIPGHYNIGVKGENFEILFSRLYGGLISYRRKGKELLAGIVKPNFWRAPTDNDNGNMMAFRYAQWKIASLYADHKSPADLSSFWRLKNPEVSKEHGGIRITYTYYLPTSPAHSCQLSYMVDGRGEVEVSLLYDPPAQGILPDFPEFSVMFRLDAEYDRMTWYGLGPQDAYPDRKRGAKLGIFHAHAAQTMANYLRPQESGNHEDVRWMQVTNQEGEGLYFDCRQLGVSVSPYSPHEIENALHPTELPPAHYTYVRIGQQMGIGGDDSWGAMTHEEFLLSSRQSRRIVFRFRGID